MSTKSHYIGRFAPSPSGPLHFGSLVAALGSYLQAKARQGSWLVRMEDLDPPREMPGAADDILYTLEAYGLTWDDTVMYQSQRHDAYQAQIDTWLHSREAYYCQCSRKQIKLAGGYYPGTCRELNCSANNSAVRLKVNSPVTYFHDVLHGRIEIRKPWPKRISSFTAGTGCMLTTLPSYWMTLNKASPKSFAVPI